MYEAMNGAFFESVMADALVKTAKCHGVCYGIDDAQAWSRTGAMYLSYVLAGTPLGHIRQAQFFARDNYGPIVLECKWYDQMVAHVIGGQTSVVIDIPAIQDDAEIRTKVELTKELFLEMLDFCREGF